MRSACIPTPWRLRNDGGYVVAYKCQAGQPDGNKHRVLSAYEAIIVPFLDGTQSEDELWSIWRNVVDPGEEPDGSLRAIFEQQIERLRQSGIVAEGGAISPSFSGHRSLFIPNFATYKFPGCKLARPLSVMVALTNYCRTDCVYCYAERKIDKELSADEWIDIFDELKDNEIYIVDILGGDALARKDAVRLLTEMAARDFVFFLSTKCPIDMSTASRLAELGVGRPNVPPHLKRDIQISVDSEDPALADRLVGRRAYLDRAKRSVKNCVAAGMAPRVKGVLHLAQSGSGRRNCSAF